MKKDPCITIIIMIYFQTLRGFLWSSRSIYIFTYTTTLFDDNVVYMFQITPFEAWPRVLASAYPFIVCEMITPMSHSYPTIMPLLLFKSYEEH